MRQQHCRKLGCPVFLPLSQWAEHLPGGSQGPLGCSVTFSLPIFLFEISVFCCQSDYVSTNHFCLRSSLNLKAQIGPPPKVQNVSNATTQSYLVPVRHL